MVTKIISKSKYLPLIFALFFVGALFITKNVQDTFHSYSSVINLADIVEMDSRKIGMGDNKEYNHKTRGLESFDNSSSDWINKINFLAESENLPGSNEDSIDFKLHNNKANMHILDLLVHRRNYPRKKSCLNDMKSNGYAYTCRQNKVKDSSATIVMFTAIYGKIDRNKYLIVNNTLTLWASLKPKVIPILFLVPNVQNINVIKVLSKTACSLGWDVQIAPECHSGLPVLRTMFEVVSPMYEPTWCGYADNGVLFDQSIVSALYKLQWYNKKIKPYGLLAGDTHKLQMHKETDSLQNYQHLLSLHTRITYTTDPASGPSYFITKKNGFPWSQFPKLVIGQPHLYNYLLWFTHYHKRIFEIDVTGAIFAVEQTIVKDDDANSTEIDSEERQYKSDHTVSNSSYRSTIKNITSYNEKIITNMTYNSNEFMNNIQYVKEKGITKCLSHKLGHMNSPYIKLFKRFTTFVQVQDPSYPCVINKYTLVRPDTEEYDEVVMS